MPVLVEMVTMYKRNIKKNRAGFTLLEAIVFVLLLSLIIIAIAQATTVAIRSNISNANKILATHYAEEVREYIRGEKEQDWDVFLAYASQEGITYCFNAEDIQGWPAAGVCGGDYSLFDKFRRETFLQTFVGPDSSIQVRATVNMSWREGGNAYSQSISTVLAPFE